MLDQTPEDDVPQVVIEEHFVAFLILSIAPFKRRRIHARGVEIGLAFDDKEFVRSTPIRNDVQFPSWR